MTTTTLPPGVIANLPIADYAADNIPGMVAPTLNSFLAARLLERSEAHAKYDHPKLGSKWPEPPNNLMNIGSAAHLVLLEPERIDDIERIPYTDWRTRASQELRDEALADGHIPLLAKDADAVVLMAAEAQALLDDSPDLSFLGRTLNEQTYVWKEERATGSCWLRCRPDMVSEDGLVIISYKTTSQNAEPAAYMKTLLNGNHDLQAGFEIAGVEAIHGTAGQTRYVWLVQEMEPPYAVSLVGLSQPLRHLGLSRFDQAVERWAACIASGKFPSYSDRIQYPEVPAWRLREIEEME